MNKRHIGRAGEDAACAYLRKNGYFILERNFRCRRGEIDVIAVKASKTLVFAEVKARRGDLCGAPCEAVNSEKLARITKAVNYFFLKRPKYKSMVCQIDVIEVFFEEDGVRVNHLENISLEGVRTDAF